MHQGAIDRLADAPAEAVVGVGDGRGRRLHRQQVAQGVVLVGRRTGAGQAAVCGIGVRHAVVAGELVVGVVAGHRLAVHADPVAVAVVTVGVDHTAVLADRGQAAAGIQI